MSAEPQKHDIEDVAETIPSEETVDATIDSMLELDGIELGKAIKGAANTLKISQEYVKQELRNRRAAIGLDSNDDGKQGRRIEFPEIDPWPERVDGEALIHGMIDAIRRYVVLRDDQAPAIALWALHTHCFQLFHLTPRLHIYSPEMRCGKSTLMKVIMPLCTKSKSTENITSASLFRLIQMYQPTLFIDEADTFINDSEELRGILNGGYERNGCVIRTVGDDYEPREFMVWSPVVIAGIGRIPSTLEDRSIRIQLHRKLTKEHVTRYRLGGHKDLEDLCRMAARWAADNEKAIKNADPELPAGLSDRAQDNWRPLLAIADAISEAFGTTARSIALSLSGSTEEDDDSTGTMLLRDIFEFFEGEPHKEHAISADICGQLNSLEHRPWPEANKGKEVTPTWLAGKLKRYGIRPRAFRQGSKAGIRGYAKAEILKAHERYKTSEISAKAGLTPSQGATLQQTNNINDLTIKKGATEQKNVAPNNSDNPLKENDCCSVAPIKGGAGHLAGTKGAQSANDTPDHAPSDNVHPFDRASRQQPEQPVDFNTALEAEEWGE